MTGPLTPENDISTKLKRIAELATHRPPMAFRSLAHHIDIDWLKTAYRRTRKNGAPGIDGQTGADYGENLEGNLRSLLDRAKSGSYRAPAVRRVHIPKGKGETRPIGIPTFEDKVLQRAVAMVLEPIFEEDFLDCSYGFRPGRSPHDALEALWRQTMKMGGCWLLEVDLRKFFDSVDRGCLREAIRRRVHDGVLLRLIGKWLKAGVFEDGQLRYPDSGTPQGGVISPLLANILLHEVLDTWFATEVQPRLQGRAFLVRYADDFVIGFASKDDALRVMDVLPKRFGKYGLAIHPGKTRLIDFRHPTKRPPPGPRPGDGDPRTFSLLGFTHYWGRSRRKKTWVIKRKTASDRLTRSLRSIASWCRAHRHHRLAEQHAGLCAKLRGHYQYYGLTGNWRSLSCFYRETTRAWRKWLHRRGQRRKMPWPRFTRLLRYWVLPTPKLRASPTRRVANPCH